MFKVPYVRVNNRNRIKDVHSDPEVIHRLVDNSCFGRLNSDSRLNSDFDSQLNHEL